MPLDFSGLTTFSSFRPSRSLIDASLDEKASRDALLEAMQPLTVYDSSVTTFDDCSTFVNTYDRDEESAQDIEAFERERTHYLKDVIAYSRSRFYSEENAEQKLFELAKKELRAIDPSLVGESRYDESENLALKVYKTVLCFFWGQLYMWCFTEAIRTWAGRHDILKWGASQNPKGLELPPIPSLEFKEHEGKDPRDILIDHVCIHQLGFEEEVRENLQALFKLFPGEIKKFNFSPKTKKFSLVLNDSWKVSPDWQKLRERFPKIPEKKGFKGVHVDLCDASILVGKVLEGEVVQEEDRTCLEFKSDAVKATVPATFNGAHLDFHIDILQWGRREDGSMTIKIDVSTGSSWFVDQAVKVIVVAFSTAKLGQATHTPILPPESKSIPIFNSRQLERTKDIIKWEKV
ncbi:hypothetical protein [Simkania sp.]|uniref:hypothetical protein n=1 Tax=Simkania sp. TaxID=34094 RepID=UPI003B51612E